MRESQKDKSQKEMTRQTGWRRPIAQTAWRLLAVLGIAMAPSLVTAGPASAEEMCGDGTTFTVALPGKSLGIDDTDGLWRNINVPAVGPPDSITLPNGCSIYALLVSGYLDNAEFDEIIFYKLAEFVAQNNGYVHAAWWNNLLGEYMRGPLHAVTITIEPSHPLGLCDLVIFRPRLCDVIDAIGHSTIEPNPGNTLDKIEDRFFPTIRDFPKANPDEDFQFQSDARRMLKAIRDNNPDAIIIVAGHSMAGASVARLARGLPEPEIGPTEGAGPPSIDLLALIDPGNNRDKPRAIKDTPAAGPRWRATHDFRGYRQWDCIRTGGLFNLCRDFDPRLFRFAYGCVRGPFLDSAPLSGSRAPFICPYPLYTDPGSPVRIGPNVKHLYYRFQHEAKPPTDFSDPQFFLHYAPRSNVIRGHDYSQPLNYQAPITACVDPGEKPVFDPDDQAKVCTCSFGLDPLDPRFLCRPLDGHVEIIGGRGIVPIKLPGILGTRPGSLMQDWPHTAQERREKMVELAGTIADEWPHRPFNPDLCLVCDDMITITQNLLDLQPPLPVIDTTAPATVATGDPAPNAEGWNNSDVAVSLAAVDEADGSGVLEIEYSLVGAQVDAAVQSGDAAEITVTAEGTTTITFLARDNAGNSETAKTIDIHIDKTPPEIAAETDVEPNPAGWNNTDIAVSFPASDALSGLAAITDTAIVTTEGIFEIAGTAADMAGNQSTAVATVMIDKTPPIVTGVPDRAPDHNGWYNAPLQVTWSGEDALSGTESCSGTTLYDGPDSADAISVILCSDVAGNVGAGNLEFRFDTNPPNGVIGVELVPDRKGKDSEKKAVFRFLGVDVSDAADANPSVGTITLNGEAVEPGDILRLEFDKKLKVKRSKKYGLRMKAPQFLFTVRVEDEAGNAAFLQRTLLPSDFTGVGTVAAASGLFVD